MKVVLFRRFDITLLETYGHGKRASDGYEGSSIRTPVQERVQSRSDNLVFFLFFFVFFLALAVTCIVIIECETVGGVCNILNRYVQSRQLSNAAQHGNRIRLFEVNGAGVGQQMNMMTRQAAERCLPQ
jgi:hypothetical protein